MPGSPPSPCCSSGRGLGGAAFCGGFAEEAAAEGEAEGDGEGESGAGSGDGAAALCVEEDSGCVVSGTASGGS